VKMPRSEPRPVKTALDAPTAAVVAALTPVARKRLDRLVAEGVGDFLAYPSEFPALKGVRLLRGQLKSRRLVLRVQFEAQALVVWAEHGLNVSLSLPATVVHGLRRRKVGEIVDHPLIGDIQISSARHEEIGCIRIEGKRSNQVPLADIQSVGCEPDFDLVDTLVTLNVHTTSRVARNAIALMSPQERSWLAGRLASSRSARFDDLWAWCPKVIESATLAISDGGHLDAQICMNQGFARYDEGRLRIRVNERLHAQYRRHRIFFGAARAGKFHSIYTFRDDVKHLAEFTAALEKEGGQSRLSPLAA